MMTYKLTQFSHGAGCGCKISPQVLDTILHTDEAKTAFPGLLVGNEERDDAAVMSLGDGTAIISTTDFFMPIVDDAFDFGRIASVNAISDVYAMGGTPLLAIGILGWPINKIPAEEAAKVMAGARAVCAAAGIPLAGGHSIDAPEPIFGLAVTGRVEERFLKKNGGAKPGDILFLTKPLGVGIFTTAQKKEKLQENHQFIARDSMVQLNRIGATIGTLDYVHAMTDVTGFGLLGHLTEMCQASQTTAEIHFDQVPLLSSEALHYYLAENCVPGGTHRNWDSYGHHIHLAHPDQKLILADPQTSGGLLVAVDPSRADAFAALLQEHGMPSKPIGVMGVKKAVWVEVV